MKAAGPYVQEQKAGASPEDPTYKDVLPPREIQRDAMTIQLEANLAYDTAPAHRADNMQETNNCSNTS